VYNSIRTWVKDLHDTWSFCPDKSDCPISSSNITHYISSPGTDMGAVCESPGTKRILRVPFDSKSQRPVEHSVGDLISKEYGVELRRFCHFGKESSIVHLLLRELMGMQVDLRPVLFRAPIYDSPKHIAKLGLEGQLPGLCSRDDQQPGALLQEFSWQSVTNSVSSTGIGVNMWGLLTLASMIGCTEIHTKNSSRFATSTLACILSMAPAAATPGRMIPVRSFNSNTTTHEFVPVIPRPCGGKRFEHFIRPSRDNEFAHRGTHTFCPVVNGMAPEDYLGCGHVVAMAKLLCCKYTEVPARHLRGFYQLIPGRFYALHKDPNEYTPSALEGTLIITKSSVDIMYWERDDKENASSVSASLTSWHKTLERVELLVMPMVFREGAAVWLSGGSTVGCLVSNGTLNSHIAAGNRVPDNQFISNFDHFNHCYCALSGDEEYEALTPVEVLEQLIPPGTMLWLKPDTDAWNELHPNFPSGRLDDGEADNRALAVRLDFPTEDNYTSGQLCVIIFERKNTTLRLQAPNYRHICVNPWELIPVGTEGYVELKELELF
jgi:hypothetical protein